MNVEYSNGGSGFRILSIRVIAIAENPGSASPPARPADTQATYELVQGVRNDIADRERIIQQSYDDLVRNKAYCEDKIHRLAFLNPTLRAEEIRRLGTVRNSSIAAVDELSGAVRNFKRDFSSRAERISFVSGSVEKTRLLDDITQKDRALSRRYTEPVKSLQSYFSDLSFPQ